MTILPNPGFILFIIGTICWLFPKRTIWSFPKMGVPPGRPFFEYSLINQPFLGTPISGHLHILMVHHHPYVHLPFEDRDCAQLARTIAAVWDGSQKSLQSMLGRTAKTWCFTDQGADLSINDQWMWILPGKMGDFAKFAMEMRPQKISARKTWKIGELGNKKEDFTNAMEMQPRKHMDFTWLYYEKWRITQNTEKLSSKQNDQESLEIFSQKRTRAATVMTQLTLLGSTLAMELRFGEVRTGR